jgi:hypothetical protein
MSASSTSIVGSLVLGSVLAFAYGGLSLYEARQDSLLALTESTATAQLRLHAETSKNQDIDSLRCDYTFMVNGNFYQGYGMCPAQGADHSVKGALLGLAGVLQNATATVYYDPANPSTNSLTEFGAKRARDDLKAEVSFGLGVVLLILVLAGMVFVQSPADANEGMMVDGEGTVIYPDKADPNPEQ